MGLHKEELFLAVTERRIRRDWRQLPRERPAKLAAPPIGDRTLFFGATRTQRRWAQKELQRQGSPDPLGPPLAVRPCGHCGVPLGATPPAGTPCRELGLHANVLRRV